MWGQNQEPRTTTRNRSPSLPPPGGGAEEDPSASWFLVADCPLDLTYQDVIDPELMQPVAVGPFACGGVGAHDLEFELVGARPEHHVLELGFLRDQISVPEVQGFGDDDLVDRDLEDA